MTARPLRKKSVFEAAVEDLRYFMVIVVAPGVSPVKVAEAVMVMMFVKVSVPALTIMF